MTLDWKRRACATALFGAAVFAVGVAAASDPAPPPAQPGASQPAQPADAATSGPQPSPAAAEMLKSMREKGMLTEDEYQELYRRQSKYEAEHDASNALPGWLKDWTFGGDMRLRFERRDFGNLGFNDTYRLGHQNIDVVSVPNTALGTQDRMRLRLRIGAEKRIVDGLTFGFRIATEAESGSSFGTFFSSFGTDYSTKLTSDPRSENVTFGDFFSQKAIGIDRAYLRWQPEFAPSFSAIVGKFGNPFISRNFAGDFVVWDPDIQLEGGALKYRFDFVPEQFWLEANGGVFTIQEQSTLTINYSPSTQTAVAALPNIDQQNPFLLAIQGGFNGRPLSWIQAGVRTSYYAAEHIGTRMAAAMEDLGNGGAAIDRNPLLLPFGGSNGKSAGRTQEIVVDTYATFTPFGERFGITPFAQFMTIPNAKSEDTGFTLGFDFGSVDLVKLTLMYAWIQRNATLSLFTDSDLFEGFTNAKGWYVSAERQLWRGVRVRGAYMLSQELNEECHDASKDIHLCDTASQINALGAYRHTTLDRNRWQLDVMVDF
jgi:hypothetical protein